MASRSRCSCKEVYGCGVVCLLLLTFVGFIAYVLFWIIVNYNPVKFYVNDVSLTEFNFIANNNTLYYNLALNMTIRNPNKRIAIYYDKLDMRCSYKGKRFAANDLSPFYQGHKNTTTLNNIMFKGQQVVALGNGDISKYNQEKSAGKFNIDVKIYLRVRFKIGSMKDKYKPEVDCGLKVPLQINGTSFGTFETTRCHLDDNMPKPRGL